MKRITILLTDDHRWFARAFRNVWSLNMMECFADDFDVARRLRPYVPIEN